MTKLIKAWLPVVAWAVVIFLFSSISTGSASRIYWQDFIIKKTAHVAEYGLLSLLIYRAFRLNGMERRKAVRWAIAMSVSYGISDEFHQSFTPGREPAIRDVIFDTIGAVLSITVLLKWLPKAPERLKNLARSLEVS